MGKLKVDARRLGQVQSIMFTPKERAALVLALDSALQLRTNKVSFPTLKCKADLRRLSRRLFASLGVTGVKI